MSDECYYLLQKSIENLNKIGLDLNELVESGIKFLKILEQIYCTFGENHDNQQLTNNFYQAGKGRKWVQTFERFDLK